MARGFLSGGGSGHFLILSSSGTLDLITGDRVGLVLEVGGSIYGGVWGDVSSFVGFGKLHVHFIVG